MGGHTAVSWRLAEPSESMVLDAQGGREVHGQGALLPRKQEEVATVAGFALGFEASPPA